VTTGGLSPDRVPLEARLYPSDAGTLRFALAESSYVALFELAPGRGVRLLYPADDATPEQRLDAGWQVVSVPAADALEHEPGVRLLYPADDAAPERALAPGWHTPPLPADDPLASEPAARLDAPAGGVRYLYLVAARRPLGITPGRRSPRAIAASIGLLAYRAADPAAQAAAVAQYVVALGPSGDWADSPLVASGAGTADPIARSTDVSVRCPGGRVYRVPAGGTQPFECPR
jgi:hypothetical protein